MTLELRCATSPGVDCTSYSVKAHSIGVRFDGRGLLTGSVVPEPGTWLLLGTGLTALMLRWWLVAVTAGRMRTREGRLFQL